MLPTLTIGTYDHYHSSYYQTFQHTASGSQPLGLNVFAGTNTRLLYLYALFGRVLLYIKRCSLSRIDSKTFTFVIACIIQTMTIFTSTDGAKSRHVAVADGNSISSRRGARSAAYSVTVSIKVSLLRVVREQCK